VHAALSLKGGTTNATNERAAAICQIRLLKFARKEKTRYFCNAINKK